MRTLPLFLLTACFVRPLTLEHDTTTWPDPVDAVLVEVSAGDVVVLQGDGPDVEVETTLSYTGERPEVVLEVVDGALFVDDGCRALQARCRLDVRVTVPRSVFVDLVTGSGDLEIAGLSHGAVLDTGSGQVDVRGLTGDLTVDTGSGDVSATGIDAGHVLIDTGSGRVDLQLDARPSSVAIDTGSGDVTLELPQGAYAVWTDTGSGDVSLQGITPDPGADGRIEVDTGSGDVAIVGR